MDCIGCSNCLLGQSLADEEIHEQYPPLHNHSKE